jgi:hypothetical protein
VYIDFVCCATRARIDTDARHDLRAHHIVQRTHAMIQLSTGALAAALPSVPEFSDSGSTVEPSIAARLKAMTTLAEHGLARDGMNKGQIEHWWLGMGHSAQQAKGRPSEIALLHRIVTSTDATGPVRTVCEIGMNAGHSATAMLEGLQTTLVEFDLFTLPYSNDVLNALKHRYPGRVHAFAGPSAQQVPRYASTYRHERRLPLCDVWFVDGDHHFGAKWDMIAALNVSRDGAVIVADDCSPKHPLVQQSWARLINLGLIHGSWNWTGTMKGWCVGRYHQDIPRLQKLLFSPEQANRIKMGDPISAAYWRDGKHNRTSTV